MTRKDFELIAAVLNDFVGDAGDVIDRDQIARELSREIKKTHPRFDAHRFLVASGVYQEKKIDGVKYLVSKHN